MSTGGQLGSIGAITSATAPTGKVMWVERSRWWNPLCANYMYAHPRNNVIGSFNASIAFYILIGGTCRLCLRPVFLKDLYMRPGPPIVANGVTGSNASRVLHKHINHTKPNDGTYVWTTANSAVVAEFSLTNVDPDPLATYTAKMRVRIARCSSAGLIRVPAAPGNSLSVLVELIQDDVAIASTTAAVGIGFTTIEYTLTPAEYAAVTDWTIGTGYLTLRLTTTASGGASTEDHSGMALSWAEVVLIAE